MFRWLANIVNVFRLSKRRSRRYDIRMQRISEKQERLRKQVIKGISTDWFHLSTQNEPKGRNVSIFQKYILNRIYTLKYLQEERLRKEEERLISVTKCINIKLLEIDEFINNEALNKAIKTMAEIDALYATISSTIDLDSNIYKRKQALQRLATILNERKIEQQKRLEEEKRKKEEEDKKKRAEFLREETERKKRLEANRRRIEELKYKERREREEKENRERREKERELERLTAPTKRLKNDKKEIEDLFSQNNIVHLYHFTDESNLKSIKEHGGLLSWYYCAQHNIDIPIAGGDESSRSLDKRYGLEDYVRLSFCADHPMAYHVKKRAIKKRAMASLVLLEIKIDVAYFAETQFSDMNATDNAHSIGTDANFIKNKINFSATKRRFLRADDLDFKSHQAEVLVKTFIPIEYITNIDTPQKI